MVKHFQTPQIACILYFLLIIYWQLYTFETDTVLRHSSALSRASLPFRNSQFPLLEFQRVEYLIKHTTFKEQKHQTGKLNYLRGNMVFSSENSAEKEIPRSP